MNDKTHIKMVASLSYENKEFEAKAKALFTRYFEQLEKEEKEFNEAHPNRTGLDGGYKVRPLLLKMFEEFEELKKEYGIVDK